LHTHAPPMGIHRRVIVLFLLVNVAVVVIANEPAFSFSLTDVPDLGAAPSDDCFYPTTLPSLISQNLTQYAWVPWSVLSNASLLVAPNGAFVYKNTAGGLLYKKIASEGKSTTAALTFNSATPFLEGTTTLSEASSNAALNQALEGTLVLKGIGCTNSPLSYTTTEPFVNYARFAWVVHGALAGQSTCGAFVYEKKDGSGLVTHTCPFQSNGDQGLSDGAKAGIIVGATLGGILLIGALGYLMWVLPPAEQFKHSNLCLKSQV